MPLIIPSLFVSTSEENIDVVLIEDLSFIQKLSEVKKMKLFYEVTFNMYWTFSSFALDAFGRGDVLIACNPSKESDAWKGK